MQSNYQRSLVPLELSHTLQRVISNGSIIIRGALVEQFVAGDPVCVGDV